MSLLGNLSAGIGLATQLAQLRRPSTTNASFTVGPTVRVPSGPPLVALPGAGAMRTGGRFGTTAAGMPYGTRKRRRTNPTNVRALRRALSRVEGFIRIEKRVDKILRKVAPRARAAQRVGFVKRRR